MKVASILEKKGDRVITTRPETSLSFAVRRLKADNIGAMVVSRNGVEIDGLLTERDIVHGLAAHGGAMMELSVADVMSHSVVTCGLDDPIREVMAWMTRHHVRHVPVLHGGRLAGIVSIGDVVKHRVEEVELEAEVLRDAYIASH